MANAILSSDQESAQRAFEERTDLERYGPNALAIFALDLYLRPESIEELASDALTDGKDDKKVDVCYINYDDKYALIGQVSISQKWGKEKAKANKASDLNTAISWLLTGDVSRIPEKLRSKAIELRQGIISGEIEKIELVFIHNCHESTNVSDELKNVATATKTMVSQLGGTDAESILITHREFGVERLAELYKSRDSDIMVDGWIDLPHEGVLEQTGDDWKAIITTVSGGWIRDLHRDHRDRLFSANFRDFLGIVKRKDNINSSIKDTVVKEPINFWVYNNGVTAITYEIDQSIPDRLRLRGISIVNGAQTSGALGESEEEHAQSAKVLLRVVECKQKELIDNIITFNNTQNEIRPFDRRSKDQRQTKLADEFSTQYGIRYVHRRDSTRLTRQTITVAGIAPVLCAFHGDPQTAYRNAKDVFNNEKRYNEVFPISISPEHVFLLYALDSAIIGTKSKLKDKVSKDDATELERKQYEILRYSMSKHFVLFVIGNCAEEIMARRIADKHEWKCHAEVIRSNASTIIAAWEAVIETLLPQIPRIIEPIGQVYDIGRSMELSRRVASELKASLAAMETIYRPKFEPLRMTTSV